MCIYICMDYPHFIYIRSIDLQLSMVFCLRLGSRRCICCGLVPYRCRFCGFDAETMWFFITQNQPFYLEDPMSFPKWNCLKPVHNIYIIYICTYIYVFDAPRVNIKMFRSIFELSTQNSCGHSKHTEEQHLENRRQWPSVLVFVDPFLIVGTESLASMFDRCPIC
jgi:hypothetical protein